MYGKRYSIGIDFGTESGRTVLVDVETGEEVGTSVHHYKDGVIDRVLPDGSTQLEPDWALQNPADYIEVLKTTIPAVIEQAGINPECVVGLGIDFTSCTMMPIDKGGTPLCMLNQYKGNPHAWVKLWKHHAAQPEADRVNQVARERGEKFLLRYGGKISSEWFFPKILQILNEAPEIYEAADRMIEGADWIVLQLTGNERRNLCTAGYKAIWDKKHGYPSRDYFRSVHPGFENVVEEKLSTDIYPLGTKAGGLTPEMARLTGLKPGTSVAVGNVDAHVAVPAATVTEPGKMVMIMGTSICHMVLGRERKTVEGMCGAVEDGILPGFIGFEAGQSAVGDIYAWFLKACVPPEYHEEAERRDIDLHALLEEKASRLKPGETGLLALDWWNGNRSVLVDADLMGFLMGCTLNTRPEEIYRALIESTAYGTRMIIKAFEDSGVAVDEIYACGGLPERNKLVMQIFADVTGREIKLAASPQTSAFGSAMFGAVAAGSENGGYDDIFEAARRMARIKDEKFIPIPENKRIYEELFGEYARLHDYFGRGENDVMKRLKRIRAEVTR
ncbi:MAG TPA: ribulokinase [Candidatus Latescibacteria bacterium]|nr:ribulokinase [Candidatus Latescibacterota bacterium]